MSNRELLRQSALPFGELFVVDSIRTRLARWCADRRHHRINRGSWIVDRVDRPIVQGWSAYYDYIKRRGILEQELEAYHGK